MFPPKDTHNHIGILVKDKCKFSDRINTVCRKCNSTFYSLSDIGSLYLNPLTMANMYKTVVRPSVLYGSDFWNNMSAKDSQRLHVFQHSGYKWRKIYQAQLGQIVLKAFLVCFRSVLKLTKESPFFLGRFVFFIT